MSDMRVVVATRFPRDPQRPQGGVEAVSVNLVRALAHLGNMQLDVVTMDRDCRGVEEQQFAGCRVHRLAQPQGSELMVATGAGRKMLKEFVRTLKPDIVHAHDTYGLMVKGLEIPRVFTIHGFIYGDTLVSGERLAWLRSKFWKWVETSGWTDQPHIISISPYVRERLGGIYDGTIHDIDNPISEEIFEIPRREREGVIFSAAAICPRKNPLVLVEALAIMRKRGVVAELRLAGPITEPEYGERLKRAIERLGLQDSVRLLGQVGTRQIMDELSQASIFALASLEENSPMGIEEAMAVGVPVVTSNRCGMPYMVRDGESGYLIRPDDTAGVAARMESLLHDHGLRERMAECARAIARDRFHPMRVAQRTRDVYVDIVRSRLE